MCDLLLWGDEFTAADVASGSKAYFCRPEQQTFERSSQSLGPVTCRVRESLQSHVNQPLAPSAPPSRPGERGVAETVNSPVGNRRQQPPH